MRSVLIFITIVLTCYLLYNGVKYTIEKESAEGFNIDQVANTGKPISNSEFSKMFEEMPLPASDELAEMGGKFAAYEGIESPRMNLSTPVTNANTWIGVD